MAIFIEGVIASADAGLPFECEKIVSLVDIIGQVKAQPDGPLDVYIQSPGGAIEEGFAIHDYLVSLERPIRTIALAQCDSIATVVFLAGQTRIARCSLMIHNPWTSIEGDSETMKASSEGLEACEKRLEKFYSEKLDIDAATISNLMQVETCITPEQALALGFANAQDVPSQSFALITKPNTNKKTKKMSKPQTFAQRCALAIKILAGAAMNLELTTADGSTLTIEREEGDPQVGDVASPDGEHVMPDGTTIVVADGVITEIIAAEGESPEEQLEAANARIADLESQLPTAEERATLNAVVALGGSKVLATMCSSYKVPPRDPQTATTPKVANYQKQLQTYKTRK